MYSSENEFMDYVMLVQQLMCASAELAVSRSRVSADCFDAEQHVFAGLCLRRE